MFDDVVRGLGVRVTAAGTKTFLCQHTDPTSGAKVRERLGTWGSITLDQARAAARARLGRVAAGHDVRAEVKAKREEIARAKADAALSLETVIADWSDIHLASRRAGYRAEAPRALRRAFAPHLDRPASKLDHAAVTAVLDEFVAAGKRAMAGRLLAYGRAAYSWACKRRRLDANPFQGLPIVEGANPKRDRVLSDDEIGAVWRASAKLNAPFGPLIRLLLLSAQRREEVAAMGWGEIAADGETWTLPAERSKNGRSHIVHLSPPARAVLTSLQRVRGQDLVFSTTGMTPPSGFSKAKAQLDKLIAEERADAGEGDKALQPWRLHDFRRSAVTWMSRAGFAPHVADRILNHVAATGLSDVALIYQRDQFLAERKAALDGWGKHVLACATGEPAASNVVRIVGRPR